MEQNIAGFFVFASVAALIYWFGLRSKNENPYYGNQLIALVFLAGCLLVNALVAFMGWRSLNALITIQPSTSVADIAAQENRAEVIVSGWVSEANEIYQENIVVQWACDENYCSLHTPSTLWIQLKGGIVGIENTDYEDREWDYQYGMTYSYYSLFIGEPVVIIGEIADSVTITGEEAGETSRSLEAEIVFAGTHEEFVESAQEKLWKPMVMIALNTAAAALLIGMAAALWKSKA